MAIKETMEQLLATLFPRGRAWQLPNWWKVITASWAVALADMQAWFAKIKQQRHPISSDIALNDWQDVLGLVLDDTLDQEQRQRLLEAIDVAVGGQDVVYLNSILQMVYPHVYIERLPNNNVLGNREARCGIARCSGGSFLTDDENSGASSRFFYYVKGYARVNETDDVMALIARLCPAHMHAIFLVEFLSEGEYDARTS